MSDPPDMSLPKQEGPIDADVKPDTGARRASGTARRSRRKKDDDSDKNKKDKEPKEAKEKPARAPRRQREKSNNPASRKKPKLEPAETRAPLNLLNLLNLNLLQLHTQARTPPTALGASYQLSQPSRPQSHSQPPVPQPPPQRTSGQNFDPIRSAFDNPSPAPSYSPPARAISPRHAYRASASPAISSIIDPPGQNSQPSYNALQRSSSGHVPGLSSPGPPAMVATPSHPSLAPSPLPISSASRGAIHIPQAMSQSTPYTTPYPPTEQRPTPSQTPKLEPSPPAVRQPQPPAQPEPTGQPTPPRQQPTESMEVDSTEQAAPSAKKEKSTPTAPASKASSPKPTRPAKEAPQLPQGSGLITNALFGGDDSAKSPDSRSTPNIIVHVPLQKGNQIVNFARLAEEQYGFAALHPRLAAHKARMARVAAAGAALERNDKNAKGISAGESADEDLSLDAERDSDMDGDVPMGGTGTGTNGAPSEASDGKKKRRRKVEEYDRDDPFVDDTEMVWQEQAAASKDGFFVYSGPLVPEGEKVQVERADGTIKRGRGRGRGTGRSRTVTSHPHVPIAAAVPVSQDTGLPLRGPGSRGGTSRRPRGNKKADGGSDRAATTASAAHESRGGRGGGTGTSNRGGTNSNRGGKSSISIPMPDLAPAPSTQGVAHGPPAPNPLAGPELMMK
ncbi:hypothetical protein N7534_007075 [Penicillium rubens]|nr:hypothetical protein N7534_007075 [Penicillium rubens]